MTIKAIETRYAGCRFRSRLEARWAVLFDQIGHRWEYEPEGFDLPSGRYLPDFLLTDPSGERCWFEVKPFVPKDEPGNRQSVEVEPRHQELAAESGLPVFVAFGMHRLGDNCWDQALKGVDLATGKEAHPGLPPHITAWIDQEKNVIWTPVLWVPWPMKSATFERMLEQGLINDPTAGFFPPPTELRDKVDAAWNAASSARFEFGESG